MTEYRSKILVIFSAILFILVKCQEPECGECDLTQMYKEWIPCKPITGGCSKSGKFTVMVRGDGKEFCPTGCRCEVKKSKELTDQEELPKTTEHTATTKSQTFSTAVTTEDKEHNTETPKDCVHNVSPEVPTVEKEQETEVDAYYMDPRDLPPDILSELLRVPPCEVFTEAQSMTYHEIYKQQPFCTQLGNRTIYATLDRPNKLSPYFECRMPPLNGEKFIVSTDEDKNNVLELMRKWKIDRVWVSRDEAFKSDPKPSPCKPSKKCEWNFKCGECCLALESYPKSGSWTEVPCDESHHTMCVYASNEKSSEFVRAQY